MNYALVDAAETALRYQDFDAPPPALAPEKGLKWLPVEDFRPEPGPGEILTGPDVTVDGAALRRVWTAAPAPPPPVPAAVSPLQMRLALRAAGLIAAATDAVAQLGAAEQDAWEYATEIRRDSPLVGLIAAELGLDDASLSDLFRTAAAIAV